MQHWRSTHYLQLSKGSSGTSPSPTGADVPEAPVYSLEALSQTIDELTAAVTALDKGPAPVMYDDELDSVSVAQGLASQTMTAALPY